MWPRIDQKTCMKAVVSAGLELVVVPMLREGDQLRTDLQVVRHHIERLGPDNIVAVVSTTSCFAPRSADNVVELARLAASAGEDSCRCNPIACFVGASKAACTCCLLWPCSTSMMDWCQAHRPGASVQALAGCCC